MSNQFDWAAEQAEQRRMRAQAMAKALREYEGGKPARFGGTKMKLASGSRFSTAPSDSDSAYMPPAGGQAISNSHD